MINKKQKPVIEPDKMGIHKPTLFFLSLFLAVVSESVFFLTTGSVELLAVTLVIITSLFYSLNKASVGLYNGMLNWISKFFSDKKLNISEEDVSHVWFIPSTLLGFGAFVICISSFYYIHLEISILGNTESFYNIVSNNILPYLNYVLILGLVSGLITQSIQLKKRLKIKYPSAILMSITMIAVFTIFFKLIILIIRSILAAI